MSSLATPGPIFWDLYGLAYDSVRLSIPYRELLENIAAALPLQRGARILDLGCGTGNLEELIASRERDVTVVGVDGSTAMLRRAERKCVAYPCIRFLADDLEQALPFADTSFDAVVVNNVFYALRHRPQLIVEAARVLRPGGVLVLSDPKPGASPLALIPAHFSAIAQIPQDRRGTEYAKSLVTVPFAGLMMVLVNLIVILKRERRGVYHFSTKAELLDLLFWADVSVSESYGGQNWFVVARRSHGSEAYDEQRDIVA